MNLLKCVLAFCLLAGTSAFALTPASITYPAPNTSGYIKVVVKPESNIAAAADVLFVIDNSGSMDVFQQALAANIPAMIDELVKFNGILHVAAITTDHVDINQSGRFQGTPAVLQSNMPSFASLLDQRLKPGTYGAPEEKPLQAIHSALSEPLLSTVNAGFLRQNVPLNVVIVSDEEDQSTISSQDFVNFVKTLKPAGDYSFFGIVPFLPSCGGGAPVKLANTILDLKGENHDICTPDWSAKLRSIGKSIHTQISRSVRLPTEPVVRTIEVKYGSQILIGGDSELGWVYDRSKMSVVIGEQFNFASEPAGTELEIKFVPKYWQN